MSNKYISLAVGKIIDTGIAKYEILGQISSDSAHSIAYRAKVLSCVDPRFSGDEIVVAKIPKIEFFSKGEEGPRYTVQQELSWIGQRTESAYNERQIAFRLQECKFAAVIQDIFIPSPSDFVKPSHETVDTSSQYMEALQMPLTFQKMAPGQTLQSIVEDYQDGNVAIESILSDPFSFLNIAQSIIAAIEETHTRGVYHHDVKPDNIFLEFQINENSGVNSCSVTLIDFGNSRNRESNSAYIKTVQNEYSHDAKFRRHTFSDPLGISGVQSDVFSVGMVLYFLATKGEVIQNPITDPEQTERPGPAPDRESVKEGIASRNPQLLDRLPVIVDVIARCIWCALDFRFASVSEIGRSVSAARQFLDTGVDVYSAIFDRFGGISTEHSSILNSERGQNSKNRLLFVLQHERLKQWQKSFEDAANGSFEYLGSMDEVLEIYTILLGLSNKHSLLRTFSTRKFWSAGNFGIEGRFLSVNEMAVKLGCTIHRIFLLNKETVDLWKDFDRCFQSLEEALVQINASNFVPESARQALWYSRAIAAHLSRSEPFADMSGNSRASWTTGLLFLDSRDWINTSFRNPASILTYGSGNEEQSDLAYTVQTIYGGRSRVIGLRIKAIDFSYDSSLTEFDAYRQRVDSEGMRASISRYKWLAKLC